MHCLRLHAETYIGQALARYNIEDINIAKSPIDASVKLGTNEGTAIDSFRHEFQSKLGTLAYPSNYTRLDITFATNYVARYSQNPSQKHMDAVDRTYAYLKGTRTHGIAYSKDGDSDFKLYSDSDHAGCTDTRRSTTGWVMTSMGGPMSWGPHRQQTVALATCDAEYSAAAKAAQEGAWVKGFVNSLRIPGYTIKTIPLYIDNEGIGSDKKSSIQYQNQTYRCEISFHKGRNCGGTH